MMEQFYTFDFHFLNYELLDWLVIMLWKLNDTQPCECEPCIIIVLFLFYFFARLRFFFLS